VGIGAYHMDSFLVGWHRFPANIDDDPLVAFLNAGQSVFEVFGVVIFRRDRPRARSVFIAPRESVFDAEPPVGKQIRIFQVWTFGNTNDDFAGSVEIHPIRSESSERQIGGIVVKLARGEELRRDHHLSLAIDKSVHRWQLFPGTVDESARLHAKKALVE